MARITVRDRVTQFSCRDNVDVEALLVTRYCNAIPHVYPIFPEHRVYIIRKGQVRWLSWSDVRRQNRFINELFEVAA